MKIIITLLLLAVSLYAGEVYQTTGSASVLADSTPTKREILWKKFRTKLLESEKQLPKIQVYGENHDGSAICYISRKQLYLFRYYEEGDSSRIDTVRLQRKMHYPSINRISFTKEKGRDYWAFVLWQNGIRVASIGAYR